MAAEIQIGGTDGGRVFLDTDWTYRWKVADLDTDATGATAKDAAAFTLSFDIRKQPNSDTALLTKTSSAGLSVSGTFNLVLATSAQYVTLTVVDTDMTTTVFGKSGGVFHYSLKRTDSGAETILAYGRLIIERATQG